MRRNTEEQVSYSSITQLSSPPLPPSVLHSQEENYKGLDFHWVKEILGLNFGMDCLFYSSYPGKWAKRGGETKRFQSQKVVRRENWKAWNSAEKKGTDGRIDCHLELLWGNKERAKTQTKLLIMEQKHQCDTRYSRVQLTAFGYHEYISVEAIKFEEAYVSW